MKIKFGEIVVDGRGKLGGHVNSKNRAGAYVRTKVTPVNPQSRAQTEQRDLISTFSRQWASLNETERLAWNGAVSSYQSTNIFGDKVSPSGFNLFLKINTNLSLAGQTPVVLPPDIVAPALINSVTISTASSTALAISIDAPVPTDDNTILVWATGSLSAGRYFVKSQLRLLRELLTPLTSASTPPLSIDLFSAYSTKFGAPATTKKVFIGVMVINNTSGLSSTRIVTDAIVS